MTYRTAKNWQLAMAVMSQVVPTALSIMMTFAAYVATGVFGATSVLAGTILTGSRIFDAVTDPICGFLVDRLNTKFGRVRPLLVIGWIIESLSILALFVLTPGAGHVWAFVVIYLIYIIGYTIFNTGDGMVAAVISDDPRQRPMVGRWAAVFKTIFSGLFSMILAATLMPKYHYQYGIPLFRELAYIIIAVTGFFMICAVIALTASGNDVTETYEGLKHSSITLREMFSIIAKSRPLQMFTIAAASDKLALQTASQSAITVMVFGIMLGDYRFNSSTSLFRMIVTIIMLFLTSKLAKKEGTKKSLIRWTTSSIVIYGIMYVFMLLVNTLDVTTNPVLRIAFIIIFCLMGASQMLTASCTQPMIADIADYEFSVTGHFSPSVISMSYSLIDKLISSVGSTIVAVAVARIGYVNAMPQATDPLTSGILHTGLFLWLGMPILGYLCTLIAMHFYKLDNAAMQAVGEKNMEIRERLREEEGKKNDE